MNQKEVIYIDVEDDITTIIDKLQNSRGKIVALVLPKRATVLQSIVNMKLMKRMADNIKKTAVLISSDSVILSLAGVVGVYVAKTPQSKPYIPDPPKSDTEAGPGDGGNIELDPSLAVGVLAAKSLDNDEPIEIDNEADAGTDEKSGTVEPKDTGKQKDSKKQKVPNFERFRTRLFIGIGIVLILIVGWFVMAKVLPKATIIITTDDEQVNVNLSLIASPSAQSVNLDSGIIPGKVQEYRKTDAQKVPTTGQKDMGTKASGSVTMSLDDCSQPSVTVAAGTAVSSNGLNFITQADVTLTSVKFGSTCRNDDFPEFSTAKVKVLAQNPGDQYNLAARSYTVSGHSTISAEGEAMSGGTTNIVKVVTQADIDGAKNKIMETAGSSSGATLSQQLRDSGYIPIADSLVAAEPLVTASPNVDTQAEEVTVTVVVVYKMTGMQYDGTKQAVEANINSQIDTSKQTILSNGMDAAIIRMLENSRANGDVPVSFQATAIAGVVQDEQKIKEAAAGKKRGEIQDTLLSWPGIKAVEVQYSPFWVMSTPDNVDKITVVYQQDDASSE